MELRLFRLKNKCILRITDLSNQTGQGKKTGAGMISLLAKIWIKNNQDVKDPRVRQAYGVLCGGVGVFLNICLFIGKFLAGFLAVPLPLQQMHLITFQMPDLPLLPLWVLRWRDRSRIRIIPSDMGGLNIFPGS